MQTTQQQLAAQYASLYSLPHLQDMLINERAALKRQQRHLAKVGTGPVGRATVTAMQGNIATLQAAIAIKQA